MTSASKPSRAPVLACAVVIVILLAALGYVYETSSATETTQGNSIASLNGQVANQAGSIGSLNGQLSSQAGQISSLSGQVTGQAGQIGSLNGQVSSYQTEVSGLNSNLAQQTNAKDAAEALLTSANVTIAQLSSQVSSYSGQVSSYSKQVSSQSSEISAQQSTISLEVQSTVVSSEALTFPANMTTTIAHFTASAAGYVQISGTSSTRLVVLVCYGATTEIACLESTSFYAAALGTSGTVNAPLMPGPVWIDELALQAGTATVTVVEYT